MNVRSGLLVLLLLAFGSATAAETISHGRFEQLRIYRPQGEAHQTVLPLCPTDSAGKPTAKLHASAKLGAPWTVLQGLNDQSCQPAAKQFLAKVGGAELLSVPRDNHGGGDFHTWESQLASAYRKLAAQAPEAPKVSASELRDLPLVEVPATGVGDTLALLISGDGGWAGIDKELAAEISKQGVPVVGLDSLRYFWKKRTPESVSADVERILRHYLAAWNKRAVLLIGFSQGADVMPFIVNRLPSATRSQLQSVALLSLSRTAVFEFHLQNWLGGGDDDVPIAPELAKMTDVRALCIYGEDDDESMCIQPEAKTLQVIKLKGGHHFDGDYPSLARLILARARRSFDSSF